MIGLDPQILLHDRRGLIVRWEWRGHARQSNEAAPYGLRAGASRIDYAACWQQKRWAARALLRTLRWRDGSFGGCRSERAQEFIECATQFSGAGVHVVSWRRVVFDFREAVARETQLN